MPKSHTFNLSICELVTGTIYFQKMVHGFHKAGDLSQVVCGYYICKIMVVTACSLIQA